jgi:hypothetical protein
MVKRDTSKPPKRKNEDVTLTDHSFVETISDGGGGWLADNAKDIHSSGVLGGLTLSWDGDKALLMVVPARYDSVVY